MLYFTKLLARSLWPALLTLVLVLMVTSLFGQKTPQPLIQTPYGLYQPGVNVLNPSFPPPNLNRYVVTNPYGVPYLVVNPNYVNNPIVPTPIVPGPIVPSPLVPNINVAPNAPFSPGFVVPNPIFVGPNAIPAGPPIWMYDPLRPR
jgi:hypothetical protein